jgi:hypothetical protein
MRGSSSGTSDTRLAHQLHRTSAQPGDVHECTQTPMSGRRFRKVLPCEQALKPHLSGVYADHGMERKLK